MENLLQMAWPFILMGVIFYLMIYRPQKRDQKKRAEMLDSLKVGTNIVTIGGILGTITKVYEDKIRIKVAEGVEMHIRKTAVGGVITSAFDKKNSRKAAKKEEAAKKKPLRRNRKPNRQKLRKHRQQKPPRLKGTEKENNG